MTSGIPSEHNPCAYTQAELDLQYNARASVPDCLPLLQEYADTSAWARGQVDGDLSVPYGPHADETLDIFPASVPSAPVYVFIHGGYWKALSKDDASFMAPAFTAAGATVVAVNYSLAPAVSLSTIVDQCRRALAWVHDNIHRYQGDRGRIHVSGSSAGGHLAGMLLAGGWQADYHVPANIVHSASPISGLFDLRPLPYTHINEWARLDTASAVALSPQFCMPDIGCPIVLAYGEHETGEFKRQSVSYGEAWRGRGFAASTLQISGVNHFNILMALRHPDSVLTQAIFELMGL